jgi:hypothetical protein
MFVKINVSKNYIGKYTPVLFAFRKEGVREKGCEAPFFIMEKKE